MTIYSNPYIINVEEPYVPVEEYFFCYKLTLDFLGRDLYTPLTGPVYLGETLYLKANLIVHRIKYIDGVYDSYTSWSTPQTTGVVELWVRTPKQFARQLYSTSLAFGGPTWTPAITIPTDIQPGQYDIVVKTPLLECDEVVCNIDAWKWGQTYTSCMGVY